MKYKLIVSDFDGTLNWYDDIVSQRQRTIEAIKAYRAKGGIFTLSTGRSYESLVDFLRAYDLHLVDVPVGCYNGAAIYSSATGELLTQYTIPNDEAIRWVTCYSTECLHTVLCRRKDICKSYKCLFKKVR